MKRLRLAIAAGLLALAAPAAADWQDEAVDTVPAELTRALIGTWYELNADGTPHKSLFSPGIKGCARPLDGEMGGDLSVRFAKVGLEAATLGTQYKSVKLEPFAEPGLRGVKLGDMTIVALTPAADGAARIYVAGGKSWDGVILTKCAAG